MDKNTDLRLRKPRRLTGTPLNRVSYFIALGVFAVGGVSWFLLEQWNPARRLKQKQEDGELEPSLDLQLHFKHCKRAFSKKGRRRRRNMSRRGWERSSEASRSSGRSDAVQSCSSGASMKKCSKRKPKQCDILSPYKNLVSDVIVNVNDSIEDKNDFSSPNLVIKKSIRAKPVKKKPVAKRSKKNTLFKYAKETASTDGYNPEHMQIAIALSKSVSEQENTETDETLPTTQEKIATIRTTLEQFGFKSNKTAVRGDKQWRTVEVNRRSKNSKFRYITPVLLLRTQQDRDNLISSKISLILNKEVPKSTYNYNSKLPQSTRSKQLFNLLPKDKSLFHLNRLEAHELKREIFYTRNMNLEMTSFKCGSLLKHWHEIPGRDSTPPRETVSNVKISQSEQNFAVSINPDENTIQKSEKPDCNLLKTNKNEQRCVSPDLFDSDIEDKSLNSSQKDSTTCVKNNSKGIYHWESFTPLNECIDLTQSSDDENEISMQKVHSLRSSEENWCSDFKTSLCLSPEAQLVERIEDECNHSSEKIRANSSASSNDHLIPSFDASYSKTSENNQRSPIDSPNRNDELNKTTKRSVSPTPHCSKYTPSTDQITNYSPQLSETKSLNVTNYIIDILNAKTSEETPNFQNHQSFDEPMSSSQDSVLISDEELNYSSRYSTPKTKPSVKTSVTTVVLDESYGVVNEPGVLDDPLEAEILQNDEVETPKQSMVVKTKDVTPMLDYDAMNTPKVTQELDKFGVKSLKRHRGVQLLKYIYEATHPVVGVQNVADDEVNVVKKRKLDEHEAQVRQDVVIVGDLMSETESVDDLVFERKQSAKVASCRVPLNIVWHNFLASNPDIHESVLLYERLQLEDLHSRLKCLGFKFHIEDLLRFLDKKCITVRTNQNATKR